MDMSTRIDMGSHSLKSWFSIIERKSMEVFLRS